MKFGKLAAAVAILSLTTSPVIAQAAKSVETSAVERAVTTNGDKAELEGENGILIALLAAAAVIAGIIIIADDEDEPTSP